MPAAAPNLADQMLSLLSPSVRARVEQEVRRPGLSLQRFRPDNTEGYTAAELAELNRRFSVAVCNGALDEAKGLAALQAVAAELAEGIECRFWIERQAAFAQESDDLPPCTNPAGHQWVEISSPYRIGPDRVECVHCRLSE